MNRNLLSRWQKFLFRPRPQLASVDLSIQCHADLLAPGDFLGSLALLAAFSLQGPVTFLNLNV